jgi:hypothetical protein
MNEETFWEIIRSVKQESSQYLLRADVLKTKLLVLEINSIQAFDEIFLIKMNQSFTWDLWALAYLAFGGCSHDGFNDFRTWLISEGRETFEKVVNNVDSFVNLGLEPKKLETFQYVASEAYAVKAKKPLNNEVQLQAEPQGDEWEEDDEYLKKRYPALQAYFEQKQESVEIAIDVERARLIERKKSSGVAMNDFQWRECDIEAMMLVTLKNCEAGKFDKIIEYLFEQWDGGDGYEYFCKVAEFLVLQHQISVAKKMWRSLITLRAEITKEETLVAMQHYLNFLRRIGDQEELMRLNGEILELRSRTLNLFKDSNRRIMSEDNFWDILYRVKEESPSYLVRPSFLQKRLLTYPIDAIQSFAEIFSNKLNQSDNRNLRALAYFSFGGCSDKGFNDFRAWLITEGQQIFECLTKNPNFIVDLRIELQKLEAVQDVMGNAYELKSQKQIPSNFQTKRNLSDAQWNEDDEALRACYPALNCYFNGN